MKMKLTERENLVVTELLLFEHKTTAERLGLINEVKRELPQKLIADIVGIIDKYSRIHEEIAQKIVVTLSALLWTYYKNENKNSINDFLMLVLSRAGFAPSCLMVDSGYNPELKTFSPLSSLIAELYVTAHQFSYEIQVNEKTFLLTSYQKQVWDKMNQVNILGVSAPTSAGKSFIIVLKAIDLLKKDGNIVYIVPTISLVSQVTRDFKTLLKQFGFYNYKIITTYNENNENENNIYVLTQEKVIAAFSQKERPFKNIRMLVIDEIQNIERVGEEDEQRAKTLYDTLIELRYTYSPDLIILSGPRLEKLSDLGLEIFNKDSDESSTKSSPVVGITYAVSKVSDTYYIKQYVDILPKPNSIKITNSYMIKGHGKAIYKKEYHSYLSYILLNLGEKSKNIIFSPTTSQARKTAIYLAENNKTKIENDKKLSLLIYYIKNTVNDNYDLANTLKQRIAYHHGKMPPHVRQVVERAMKDGIINSIVCTTTLMQGVNLPAQNVIMRNPNLFIKSFHNAKPKLTNYEIANLRGRAGRLLKDFIGRTFILDENAFVEENDDAPLFNEAEKKLHASYNDKFIKYNDEIISGLHSNQLPTQNNEEYSFLMTFIRQVIIRYKEYGYERLKAVGIEIEREQYKTISKMLHNLAIPVDLCRKNRYWDPLDLMRLYKSIKKFVLPISVNDKEIVDKLYNIILFLKNNFQIYFQRYFNIENENKIKSVCVTASKWLRETPLKEILNNEYYNQSPDRVEEAINICYNKISFGMPMLIKPLFDINASDRMFLRFIEMGAFRPITRRMIEMNIPRETSIYLSQNYFEEYMNKDDFSDDVIVSRLLKIKDNLDYWTLIQLDTIL
jgi:hypothetical protein